MFSSLVRLQTWYAQQCNGEWEHDHGITLQSCDNPGWWVKINLKGTSLAQRQFERVVENVDSEGLQCGEHWLDGHLADGIWSGAGDETKLERILEIFLSWAETSNSL